MAAAETGAGKNDSAFSCRQKPAGSGGNRRRKNGGISAASAAADRTLPGRKPGFDHCPDTGTGHADPGNSRHPVFLSSAAYRASDRRCRSRDTGSGTETAAADHHRHTRTHRLYDKGRSAGSFFTQGSCHRRSRHGCLHRPGGRTAHDPAVYRSSGTDSLFLSNGQRHCEFLYKG